jgi:hypothetical protein
MMAASSSVLPASNIEVYTFLQELDTTALYTIHFCWQIQSIIKQAMAPLLASNVSVAKPFPPLSFPSSIFRVNAHDMFLSEAHVCSNV